MHPFFKLSSLLFISCGSNVRFTCVCRLMMFYLVFLPLSPLSSRFSDLSTFFASLYIHVPLGFQRMQRFNAVRRKATPFHRFIGLQSYESLRKAYQPLKQLTSTTLRWSDTAGLQPQLRMIKKQPLATTGCFFFFASLSVTRDVLLLSSHPAYFACLLEKRLIFFEYTIFLNLSLLACEITHQTLEAHLGNSDSPGLWNCLKDCWVPNFTCQNELKVAWNQGKKTPVF